MKAKDLIEKGVITLEELKIFLNGDESVQYMNMPPKKTSISEIQEILNKETGFEKTILDLNTDEEFNDNDVINANFIDAV